MAHGPADLFRKTPDLPEGFRYEEDVLDRSQEEELVRNFAPLEFAPFEFHGFLGKRRVVFFGWRYDFGGGGLKKGRDIPPFLLPIRHAVASLFTRDAPSFEQVLVTEYAPGAAIGWHKDRSVFGDVIGVSLASTCIFRFRRKTGAKWDRRSLVMQPRSAYLLHGSARTEWEHSIPAHESIRYSITFRTLRGRL